MGNSTKWGVCTTAKATTHEVLRFAAYYLDAGAHRVWICLDSPDPVAQARLQAHPKCRITDCDGAYWRRVLGRKPEMHQRRQSQNATRIYADASDVDWILHADADEFLVSPTKISTALDALPGEAITARVRPMEALARHPKFPGPIAFKKFIPPGPDRQKVVNALYPRFGAHLKGGFLSHVAGKLIVRTGLTDLRFKIHNVFQGETANPGAVEMTKMSLAHLHTPDWDSWAARFRYRLNKGAYRSDLGRARKPPVQNAPLHDFFSQLVSEQGEQGLRSFFDEVCTDSENLRRRLGNRGLLELQDLRLDAKQHQFFPG